MRCVTFIKKQLVMHDQKGFGATMPEEGLDRGKLQERLRRLLPKRPPNDEVPLEPPEELVELRESKYVPLLRWPSEQHSHNHFFLLLS